MSSKPYSYGINCSTILGLFRNNKAVRFMLVNLPWQVQNVAIHLRNKL